MMRPSGIWWCWPIFGAMPTGCWLAQAGLLDGREATSYWRCQDDYRRRFPAVNWCFERLITESANLCCAAGASAMNDLLLHQVNRLCGAKVASGISRDIMFDMRRAYDFTPLGFGGYKQHGDRAIEQVQQWLESHYPEQLVLAEVARRHGMSLRNFARRFVAATGEKPLAYLQRIRVDVARNLLIHSDKPIQQIALAVGYQDSSYFCRQFRLQTRLTPAVYRRHYRLSEERPADT
ncbi:MAG: helix-turn-helix domain-containing protein [Motiliproteus sp.]